jgi:hypothetical protein
MGAEHDPAADPGRLVSTWEMMHKDNDGEAVVTQLHKYVHDDEDTERTFLSQAAPTIIRPSRSRPKARKNLLAADIPDLQFGFRRMSDGSLEPLHDPKAMDVALQVIKDAQPDLIVLGGDELDLPELSRFKPDSRHFVDTLQVSIDGLHRFLAQLRCENPNARIVNLDSNHIRRLGNYMLQHAMPLFGVRRANMPDDWPVMSYAHLLRLDELDIEWNSGYPAAEFSINDRLGAVHGDRSNSKGSTAAQYLQYRDRSLLFHHTHRTESQTRTLPSGKSISAFSFGSLTRNDGAVPAYGSAVSDKGDIVHHVMNWQTGIGLIEYDEGDKPFQPHAVVIDPAEEYVTMHDGKEYRPRQA